LPDADCLIRLIRLLGSVQRKLTIAF
jgi:hypothetical protein